MSSNKSKVKTVETLEPGDCRWPIGDPRHPDFHFCGAQQVLGRPYCQHHWQLSFTTRQQQQQAQGPQQAKAPALPARRAA